MLNQDNQPKMLYIAREDLFQSAAPLTGERRDEIRERLLDLGDELTASLLWPAVKAAHKARKISAESFARDLFIQEGTGGKPLARKTERWADWMDPYSQLDLKTWCAYLRYGHNRIVDSRRGATARDQQAFFEFFNLGNNNMEVWNSLKVALDTRNALEHENEKMTTPAAMARYVYALVEILEDMEHEGWTERCHRWIIRLTKELYAALGETQYSLESVKDYMAEIGYPVEPGKAQLFEELLTEAGLAPVGGKLAFSGNIIHFITKYLALAWDQADAAWEDSVRHLRRAGQGELPVPDPLTDRHKKRMIDAMEDISPRLKELLGAAAREAHKAAGISEETFENTLYVREGTGKWYSSTQTYGNNSPLLDRCYDYNLPEDPYKRLDLHGWLKYLRFGGCRIVDAAAGKHAVDQDAVFEFLGIPYSYTETDPRALSGEIAVHLKRLNDSRNQISSHWTAATLQVTTTRELMQWYEALKALLVPLSQREWARQKDSRELLETLESSLHQALKERTYSVDDILEYMQFSDKTCTEIETLLKDMGLLGSDRKVTVTGDIQEFMRTLLVAVRLTRDLRRFPPEPVRAGGELYERVRERAQKNDELALRWIERAANANPPSAAARYYLGCCYLIGRGKEQDEDEALFWIRSAAKKGCAPAQVRMGQYCEENIESEKQARPEDAFRWYQKAADQDYAEGQYQLARCYEHGIGTESNYEEAFQCYQEAARQGHSAARFRIAQDYDEPSRRYDPAKALRIYRELAEEEYAPAVEILAGRPDDSAE